jgi:catechol 2,3-dioxygenase-like lactoylglutathione lyase family enzyme
MLRRQAALHPAADLILRGFLFPKIDHVQVAIPRGEEQARDFYIRVLGFSEIAKPLQLAKNGGLWLSSGAATLPIGIDPDFHPAHKAHPAIVGKGYAGLVSRLRLAGFNPVSDCSIPGVERHHLHDPSGNRIELIAAR